MPEYGVLCQSKGATFARLIPSQTEASARQHRHSSQASSLIVELLCVYDFSKFLSNLKLWHKNYCGDVVDFDETRNRRVPVVLACQG